MRIENEQMLYNPTVRLESIARNDTSRIGTAVVQLSDILSSYNDNRGMSDKHWLEIRDEFVAALQAAEVGDELKVPSALVGSLTRQNFLYRVTKIAAEGK